MSNSFRIRTEPGVDKSLNVLIEQEFEYLEILSLKLLPSQIYTRQCSDYGVIVGRVSVNNGFGIPKSTIRIVGIEQTQQVTQIKVRIKYLDAKYEGCGESETAVRAVMIELVDGKVPFEKMTVSNALKKAIHEAVVKLPN